MSTHARPGVKRVVPPPRGKGRRTQEERAQLSALEQARTGANQEQAQQERSDAAQRAEQVRRRASRANRGRVGRWIGPGRNVGQTFDEPQGAFAGGSVIEPERKKTFPRPWAPSKRGRTGPATSWGPKKIKREQTELQDVASGSNSLAATDNRVESDSDTDQSDSEEKNRLNIDHLDFTGDDDEEAESNFVLPIRMIRHEHQDRTTQSITKTEDVQAKEEGADENAIVEDTSIGTSRKGKNKIRELESPRVQRPWVGVFPEEELDYPHASAGRQPPPRSGQDSRRSPKAKDVHRRGFRDRPVGWNTKEHQEEWDRTLTMMDVMVKELERPEHARPKKGETVSGDATEDINKSGQIYLFQFPATMPPLVLQSQMEESATSETKFDNKEEKEKWLKGQRLKLKDQSDPLFINNRPDHLPKTGGRVGKLRVYKSGKTEIDWGGLPFKLKTGIEPNFFQEGVLVRSNDKPTADREGYIGNAYSLGEIRSKFIVVPDLAKFFPTLDSDTE